jgi:hypothetical protein
MVFASQYRITANDHNRKILFHESILKKLKSKKKYCAFGGINAVKFSPGYWAKRSSNVGPTRLGDFDKFKNNL